MIAFVTGGTGFVGGHLCERLRAGGWEVRALARATSNTSILKACGCQIVTGDLDSIEAMREAIHGANVVHHVAGITRAWRFSDFARVNGLGTRSVLNAAKAANFDGTFVLLSSLAAAGPAPGRPRTEADEPRPVSVYGESKRLGELEIERAAPAFPTVILRPGPIYGPREHEAYRLVKQLDSSGVTLRLRRETRVQMTHVDDVVSALLLAGVEPAMRGRTYFVNDQRAWPFSEIMTIMGGALGRPIRQIAIPEFAAWGLAYGSDAVSFLLRRVIAPFNRDKIREITAGDWIGDSSRLSAETTWRAKWELPEGLRASIRWYRENGWLPK